MHSFAEYEQRLAPYAARSAQSRGRACPEPEHPYRSPFQRDRDRIIHSSAFRRLESKTQVYTHLYQEGDQFRKRLTHTLEVAQIARSVSRALGLNEDLTEAIALVHDIGHAPFGHKGQDILNELMKNSGGFEHNTQALRIVCSIENRYPDFKGLNLTYELREAIAKKGHGMAEPAKAEFDAHPHCSLEGQVVDLCDPITYTTHDLDDGIVNGAITPEMLRECELWNEGVAWTKAKYPAIREKLLRHQVVRYIINEQATDLINQTQKNIEEAGVKTIDEVRVYSQKIAGFSPAMRDKHKGLKQFLQKNMYDHYRVKRMESHARKIITELFNIFLDQPELFPPGVRGHFDEEKKKGNEKRIVCDYIAGMTDSFAQDEYEKLFGHSPKI